jgi:hypothetical protein
MRIEFDPMRAHDMEVIDIGDSVDFATLPNVDGITMVARGTGAVGGETEITFDDVEEYVNGRIAEGNLTSEQIVNAIDNLALNGLRTPGATLERVENLQRELLRQPPSR